jgi:hypothetical protein
MPSYLVEMYLAGGHERHLASCRRRARSAAAELSQVSFDRSIHVPEDEICFFVFDAPSSAEVALVAQRAELEPLRIVEAVSSTSAKEGT